MMGFLFEFNPYRSRSYAGSATFRIGTIGEPVLLHLDAVARRRTSGPMCDECSSRQISENRADNEQNSHCFR